MSEFKVFYSWQSDLPNATNRGFIGDALAKACKEVANNPEIEEAPRVDQDTQGVPGSPAIPATIMEKIDECQAFVADVTLCFSGPNDKVAPNPNVIYELGYAVARLGWDRIILVMNLEHGAIDSLPFDLEKRRVTGAYTAKVGENDRSEQKKALTAKLVAGIEAIARRQPIVPKRTPADVAIEAIEGQLPARRARIREFWKWVSTELHRVQPDLKSHPPTGEHLEKQIDDLESSIENSAELSRLWSRVCEAVAITNDTESVEEITRGFGDLIVEYDHQPGFSGRSYDTWFDFWRFSGHELYTVWIGCLLKEERWDHIDLALSKSFFWQMHQDRTNHGLVTFEKMSVFVRLLDARGKANRRLSYHADILFRRYGPEGINSTLTFKEFIDGDLFLFLAATIRNNADTRWLKWRPWSVLYMKHQPRFLLEATNRGYASGVKVGLGENDSDIVRGVISEKIPDLHKMWNDGFWDSPITKELIDSFDSKG